MYKAIENRRSVRKLFTEALVRRGDITLDEAEAALADFQSRLQVALDETRAAKPSPTKAPRRSKSVGVLPHIETGVPRATLDTIFDHLTEYPEGFTVHPKLARQFASRAKLYHDEQEVEWATAEALAVGSLLVDGSDVRIAGEDTRRGTFSQRHMGLVDFENGR